jgi:hypothetical protein
MNPSAQHRENVYAFLENIIGRRLTDREHAELRSLLIDYIEYQRKANPNIKNHVFICQGCYGVTMGYGRTFAKLVKTWNKHQHALQKRIKEDLL